MLCPKLATLGKIVDQSLEGVAFADRDYCNEFEDCSANAMPLQVILITLIVLKST
jgi:hypothetical protein